jgi:hypothetical protein
MKISKSIAWFRHCAQRIGVYVHIYNACMLTALLIIEKGLPRYFIPIGVVVFLLGVLIAGSLDTWLGIFKEEQRIGHENSPVLMEILKNTRR